MVMNAQASLAYWCPENNWRDDSLTGDSFFNKKEAHVGGSRYRYVLNLVSWICVGFLHIGSAEVGKPLFQSHQVGSGVKAGSVYRVHIVSTN